MYTYCPPQLPQCTALVTLQMSTKMRTKTVPSPGSAGQRSSSAVTVVFIISDYQSSRWQPTSEHCHPGHHVMQKHFHTDHRHLFAIIGFNGTLYQQQYLILYVHLTPEFTACLYTGFCITIYRRHNWLQCKWLSKQLLLWLLLCLPACNYSLNRAPYISCTLNTARRWWGGKKLPATCICGSFSRPALLLGAWKLHLYTPSFFRSYFCLWTWLSSLFSSKHLYYKYTVIKYWR